MNRTTAAKGSHQTKTNQLSCVRLLHPFRMFCPALWVAVVALLIPRGFALTVPQLKEIEAQVKQVMLKASPAVVSLNGDMKGTAGSGVVISADGLILTAAHVTQGNKTMTVLFPDGKEAKCTVLGANYTRDIALAKFTNPGPFPFVELGDSDKLEPTTMVVALGHPGGFDARRTPPLRLGRVHRKNVGGFVVSDCTLVGGDSGGPLFDLDGKVVGIHSSISESLAYNRSAPVNAAKADWQRLLAGEKWGKLAGAMNDVFGSGDKPVIGATLDEAGDAGVRLQAVHPHSPAEAAGLKAGDIVVKFGGEEMRDAAALKTRLGKRKPGDSVEVIFRRDGAEQKATVLLISQTEMLKRLGMEESK